LRHILFSTQLTHVRWGLHPVSFILRQRSARASLVHAPPVCFFLRQLGITVSSRFTLDKPIDPGVIIVIMLATYYPPSFVLFMWVLVLWPIYPGLFVCMIAFIQMLRGRKSGGRLARIGGLLLLLGAGFVAWNWDSITSGNPYHMF
ncbi:hypothetical protein, partial [Prosthecobacter sp.]|uniref:hypothetical protein n=1 Tax=Prosthecobacter sp. TaxID=1965333 RepID=UPI0037841C15